MKILLALFLAFLTCFGVSYASLYSQYALAATTFNQDLIIDDSTFNDVNSLSAAQIDTFLNTFSGSCISSNSGFKAIDPVGYNPTSGFLYGGYVTAGQVIYDAAQAYGLNPQVLLATLQKEEGLVDGTGTYGCTTKAITSAVGYGCPDGGATYSYTGLNLYQRNGATVTDTGTTCVNSASRAGFTQQIIRATWLLRFGEQRSEGNVNWAVVKGNWNNSDDPQSCYSGPMTQGTFSRCQGDTPTFFDGYTTIDGTAVHMDSGATAAMYWYTPHFEGNQNFVTIFNTWFGPTYDRIPLVRASGTGKFYIRGSNNSLIYITSNAQLTDIGYGVNWRITAYAAADDTYLQAHDTSQSLAAFVSFGTAPEVYYYAYGGLHYVSYAAYQAYGSPVVSNIDGYIKNYFWIGDDGTTLLKNIGNGDVYSIANNHQKRYVAGPSAFTYYNFNSANLADAGPTILGTLTDGAPLATPGTLAVTSGNQSAGIIDSTGNGQYPVSSTLMTTLAVPRLTVLPALFAQLSVDSTSTLGSLAQDSSGNTYILDQAQKIKLASSQLSASGYTSSDAILAPDVLLNELSTVTTTSDKLLFRIDNSNQVYAAIGKQMEWIESLSDFSALGYSFSNVIDLKQATATALFSNTGISLLPAGTLVHASGNTSVYLVTAIGQKSFVPTSYLFTNLGFSFSGVRTANAPTLSNLQTQSSILPYAIDGSGNDWLIYGGTKRQIPAADVSAYALTAGPNQITLPYLQALPTGATATKFIRIDTTQNVYYVDSGSTHLLSVNTYKQYGGTDWSDVISVTQDLFNALTAGAAWL